MPISKAPERATVQPTGFPWLGVLLVVSLVTLFFQFFPGVWWGLVGALEMAWLGFLAIVDVRNWTWKVYATLSAIAIVALIGLKAWLER